MTHTQKLLSALFITAASAAFIPAQAAVGDKSVAACSAGSEADCACVRALEIGNKRALEDFQSRYSGQQTACNSLATSWFGDNNTSSDRNQPRN